MRKLYKNRNMYVWFIPGDRDGILAYATFASVKRFMREGDTFRQAFLRDWINAKKLKSIRK